MPPRIEDISSLPDDLFITVATHTNKSPINL